MNIKISTLRAGIVGAVLGAATLVVAAPTAKIVGAKVSGGKLVATVQTGAAKKQIEAPNYFQRSGSFLVGENGKALVYETLPGKNFRGGYENEQAAVGRYAASGKFNLIMEAPINLNKIREYRSRRGRTAYVISMQDGGAGIPYVYVCSTQKTTWDKRAVRVAGARNGRLILKQYVDGEESGYEDAKPIKTLYLDLDKLLDSGK